MHKEIVATSLLGRSGSRSQEISCCEMPILKKADPEAALRSDDPPALADT
jgi:hypothetical protein